MEKMSQWIVSQALYSEVQVGRGAAAGARHFDRRVARALEINRGVLHHWRKEFRQGPQCVPGHGRQCWSEGRIAELERKIGQQRLEIDGLKGCLQRIEEQRMLQASNGNLQSTGRSGKK